MTTDKERSERVALVTGASSGMGKEFARALLREGFTVYATARRVERMADLGESGAIVLRMDITKEDEILAAVEHIEEDRGGVDILVNNAGFGLYGSMEETAIEDARYQFEVNLFGMARLTQLLLPSMRRKGAGKIINISSMGGRIYTPLGSWYHATKHAVEGWSDCLRLELASFGIDVVIIEPGVIETEFGDVLVEPLLKRSGTGPYRQMAEAVAASTRATYRHGGGSEPKVIVDLLLEAVRAKRPETRYVAGKYARPMIFFRKWFGDRFFDRVILMSMNRGA